MSDPVYRYLCRLAGVTVLCTAPFEITIHKESKEFLLPLSEGAEIPDADFFFTYEPAEALPLPPPQALRQQEWQFLYENGTLTAWKGTTPETAPYACVRRTMAGREIRCAYLRRMEGEVNFSRNLVDLLELEIFFLQLGGILLHSSLIRAGGRGILFTAPCGTGKSTQAELWRVHEGAQVLNGDRACIRRIGGVWTACGLPVAGTSGIYHNETAPLKAIVVLEQGPENVICPMKPVQALSRIYPETSVHRWDPELTGMALDILTKIVTEIPVFLLSCRPDAEAVATLKAAIAATP